MIEPTRILLSAALGLAWPAACGPQPAMTAAVAEQERITLRVEGMACESCAGRLAKELREREGVFEVDVEFADQRAAILYDPRRLTVQTLVEAVDEIGFEAFAEIAVEADVSASAHSTCSRIGRPLTDSSDSPGLLRLFVSPRRSPS